jgi:ammonia channel protein AmtB
VTISSALVLLMTIPGLALFYGGLVRVQVLHVLRLLLLMCSLLAFFCGGLVRVQVHFYSTYELFKF